MIEDDIVRGTDEIDEIESNSNITGLFMSWDMVYYMQKLNVSCDTLDTNEYIKLNITGS